MNTIFTKKRKVQVLGLFSALSIVLSLIVPDIGFGGDTGQIGLPVMADQEPAATAQEVGDAGQTVSQAVGDQEAGASRTSILYDGSNGLPTSEANTILQSSEGFIWIGSYSGLIRYDGNEFYRYDSSVGISSVVSLFEDSKNRLWIGTNDSGVAMYENGEFTFYEKEDGLSSSSIRALEEDKEGNILIATTLGMAYVDQNGKLHALDDPQINGEYVCEIHRGADDLIYGETLSGGFFSIDDKRVQSFYSGPDLGFGVISCIYPDPEYAGYVYLGTETSNVIYGNMNEGMEHSMICDVEPQVNINAISVIDGTVWVCADNGIGYMEPFSAVNEGLVETGRFQTGDSDSVSPTVDLHYTELNNIPMNNSVDGVIQDYEGDLWFVSSRQGVMKVAQSQFMDISMAAGLDPMVVNTTCLYHDDLYVGTDTGLLILDASYQKVKSKLYKLIGENRIRCIKKDRKDNLWICTYSELGLICYHPDGTYTLFHEKNGFASNRVRTVEELSDGRIIASCSGGVYVLENEKITGHYDSSSGISNTEILCIAEGDDGELYLGSDGDGLYKVEGNKTSRYGLDDGLGSEVVMRIKKDEEHGLFWIVTSNSIGYMKDEKFYTATNFPYSNNFDIFTDNQDNAWVFSSNGVYVTSVDNLLNNPKDPEYLFYDTKCGMPCVATANSRSAVDDEGNVYLAGSTGISKVNINKVAEEEKDVRLTVPFVEIDGKQQAVSGNQITLPSSCKRLDIYGYALTFSLKNPRVQYYLEGFDDAETNLSKQEMGAVSYTNLSGGRYKFHLSVLNTLTGEEQDAIVVNIIKKRAPHEYVVFWVLIVAAALLFLVLVVIFYYRRKTARLLKQQEEKQEFIDEVINAFAKCIDMKDKYTNGHSKRVAYYSKLLAQKMGYPDTEVRDVYNIALLHDIGKILIPDEILNKPGRPTDEEYEILKQHAGNGYEILKDITVAPNLAIGAGYHHERLDGKGYPNGVNADQIPEVAQIIAVADTFDAMYSTRPYRKQMELGVVVAELKRVSGTQLNAQVVNCLEELVAEKKIGGTTN